MYYTTNPNQPEASWDSQMVDNSELTTISELTPHAIYTIRVQAFTSMGAGPMSNPVQVKTQQGNYYNMVCFVFVCVCLKCIFQRQKERTFKEVNRVVLEFKALNESLFSKAFVFSSWKTNSSQPKPNVSIYTRQETVP